MQIYDSLSKKKVELTNTKIKMYFCGPTIYDSIHIGNGRPLILGDVLFRYFRIKEIDVIYTRNITDIDDKILNAIENRETDYNSFISGQYEDFLNICKKLNLLHPTFEPRVSQYIDDIIQYIQKLIKNNCAYVTKTGVYFDVNSVKYWNFKNQQDNTQHRIENEEDKRNIEDFALWKISNNKYAYDSEFGKGFPGWHIECSVMSLCNLGEEFHIHGGGIDLSFPHHENEMAQALGFCGKNPASIWMHNEMININKEKMSKSLNNFTYLKDILLEHDSDVIRYLFLSHHYRNVIDFNDYILEQVETTIRNIRKFYFNNKNEIEQAFINIDYLKVLDDDFDTPKALEAFHLSITNNNYSQFKTIKECFGFKFDVKTTLTLSEIHSLIYDRTIYRKNREYQKADEIRNKLSNNYVEIRDLSTGQSETTEWHYI